MKIQFSFHKNIPTKTLYVDLMCPKCITTRQKCHLLFKLRKCSKFVGTFSGIFRNVQKSFGKIILSEICVSRLDVFDRNLTHLTQKKLAGIVWTLKMTSLWYNLFFNSLNSCVWFSKKLQQKWTSTTVNLIEGNKLQTFFKVYILTIMGTKSKYSTIYKTTCLWLMGPLEFWTFWRHVYGSEE